MFAGPAPWGPTTGRVGTEMPRLNFRTIGVVLWALVIIVGIGLAVQQFVLGPSQTAGSAGIGGGSYDLVDHLGRPVDETMLTGHPSMLFFGFTHCPDVCPTTLSEMSLWFSEFGDTAGDLTGYFVTVDPERDTPEIMAGYVEWVSDRMVGVTGTRPEIDKMIAAWRVYAEKVAIGDDGDYTMNHTASVFLINSEGGFEGTIAYGEAKDTALKKICKLLAAER